MINYNENAASRGPSATSGLLVLLYDVFRHSHYFSFLADERVNELLFVPIFVLVHTSNT